MEDATFLGERQAVEQTVEDSADLASDRRPTCGRNDPPGRYSIAM
jgi:hypothetical protein